MWSPSSQSLSLILGEVLIDDTTAETGLHSPPFLCLKKSVERVSKRRIDWLLAVAEGKGVKICQVALNGPNLYANEHDEVLLVDGGRIRTCQSLLGF